MPELKNIKILYLVKTMDTGGAEKFTLNLARYFADKTARVTVASTGGIFVKELEKLGIRHILLGNNPTLLNLFALWPEILKIIREDDYNIVHCQHRIFVFILQFLCNKKFSLLYTAHNIFHDLFQRMIFPQYTVAISSSINNNLLKSTFLSKSSIRQINLGIVIPSEPKIISREVTLGFLGRLIEEKGIFNLLDAVKMLETDKIMFKLIIRGKGETDKIMRFIKSGQMENYVSLSPSLYEENEVYKGIDVLVLPSMLNEGLPLSILEAAVRRILIVTTGAGGIGDFIVNQVTGITLVSTSPEQIAATLKEAILNYNNYESILENSYVKAKNEFSLEQMTTKYEQFYSTVINSNSID